MAEFRPVNLAEIYGQVDAARANQASMQNNAMMQERQRRQFALEDEEANKKRRMSEAYKNSIDVVDGAPVLNRKKLSQFLLQEDPTAALEVEDKFAQMDATKAKAKTESAKAELENRKATAAYLRDRLAGVQDQATYDAVMSEAAELGAGFINGAPREFNHDFVRNQLFTADEFLKQSTPKYEKVDLGGKIQVIDVNPMTNPSIKGMNLEKTQTPDSIASTRQQELNRSVQIRGQNLTDARAREANSAGKAPAGYRYLPDGSLEAIKGGPADIKAGELGAKRERQQQGAVAQADRIISKVDQALSKVGKTTAGAGYAATPRSLETITGAKDLESDLETIKANLGFAELQAMRDASPTGGALGAIAVQELIALQSTVASLDQKQSPQQLKARLSEIKNHYENWKNAVGGKESIMPKNEGMPNGDVRSKADKILGL